MESTPAPAIGQVDEPVDIYMEISRSVRKTDKYISVWFAAEEDEEEEEDEDSEGDGPVRSLPQTLKRYYHNYHPYCIGAVDDAPIYLDDKTQAAGTLLNPNLELLLAQSQPAPFGRGEETVFDESVRRARSIPGARLTRSCGKLNNAIMQLASQLHWGKCVEAELSKLHIYEENGHFTPHRDTLRSNDHIGSIVVLLGTPFTGGEFVINGEQCALDVDHAAGKVPFVAFYTDILHEVRPVTSGVRMSLQFDVFVRYHCSSTYYNSRRDELPFEDHFWPSTCAMPVVDENRCREVVAALAFRLRWSPNLIIPTFHRYHQHALHTSTLKPIDELLVRKLVELGYSVTPVPLKLVEERDNYDFNIGASLFWQEPYKAGKPEFAPNRTQFVVPTRVEGEQLFSQRHIEHTGNESQPAILAYYLSGLLISAVHEQTTSSSGNDGAQK